jgi:hypothetical protein
MRAAPGTSGLLIVIKRGAHKGMERYMEVVVGRDQSSKGVVQ